jgi:predicted AAA+ superfamily ATPase
VKRDIEHQLKAWKDQPNRLPLLIRGPRQVGKTYVVEQFGNEFFENVVLVNFELYPRMKQCFESLDPKEIINKLRLMSDLDIEPGRTLLFLDEIQECPHAIMSLRYFKEKMPELHVIGAGSLLEFALREEDFRMPVGRVQFVYLGPFSFGEFLGALNRDQLRGYLGKIKFTDQVDPALHGQLLDLLRKYFILGGMPAVLQEYLTTGNLKACQNIQSGILETYRNDFGKYAKKVQHKYLQRFFESAPRLVGQGFKYAHVDPQVKSRELKQALELLVLAGLIHPVYVTSASGLPLGFQVRKQKFKIIFLDVGLAQNACGLRAEINFNKDLLQINAGSVAEQFVGQELRAYGDAYTRQNLYFWARNKKGSMAEIDFVVNVGSRILPLEVKAGKTGTLKSLKLFLKEKKAPFGIRVSENPLSYHDDVLSIPLYMLEQISRMVEAVDK